MERAGGTLAQVCLHVKFRSIYTQTSCRYLCQIISLTLSNSQFQMTTPKTLQLTLLRCSNVMRNDHTQTILHLSCTCKIELELPTPYVYLTCTSPHPLKEGCVPLKAAHRQQLSTVHQFVSSCVCVENVYVRSLPRIIFSNHNRS